MSEYYLNIPSTPYSSAPYIELPVYLGVNWGLSAYAIEFSIMCELSDSGLGVITIGAGENPFGNNTLITCSIGAGSGSTGYIQVRGSSPSTGQVTVATSASGIPIKDGQFHTYRFEHDADGTCRFKVDGNVYGPTSSFTTSVNGTAVGYGVKRIFRTINGVIQDNIRCRYIKYEGFTNSDTWDANLSNGTATVFPSLSGTRDGVQVGSAWPSDNSEWVSLVIATPVVVSVGKTNYTPTNKKLSTSIGNVINTNKALSNILVKSLNVSNGYIATVSKSSYNVINKHLLFPTTTIVLRSTVPVYSKKLTLTLSYAIIPVDQVYNLSNANNFYSLTNRVKFLNLTDK